MPSVKTALAAGFGATAIAAGVTLTQAPATVVRSNSVPEEGVIASIAGDTRACQADEALPRAISAIRLSLQATIGPRITVEALAGGAALTHGTRGSGWTAGAVTVPVSAPEHSVEDATICYTLGPTRGPVEAYGEEAPAAVALYSSAGQAFAGRMKIEYLRPGASSWWSRIRSIARRMGFGHALSGTWLALLAAGIALSALTLASWLVIRELA
jgi:hypothetical protein